MSESDPDSYLDECENYPVFRLLECQLGDPVLAHSLSSYGVVAGTALGRLSAYIFDYQLGKSRDSETTITIPGDSARSSKTTRSSISVWLRKVFSPPHHSHINQLLHSRLPGRYTVLSSFSDEPIQSVFMADGKVYSMVGTNVFNTFDCKNYKIIDSMSVDPLRNSGSKQILTHLHKVLIETPRGFSIVQPTKKKQSINTCREFSEYNNLLDFDGDRMLCYQRHHKQLKIQIIQLLDTQEPQVTFTIDVSSKTHLVTHGKFWATDRILIVLDARKFELYEFNKSILPCCTSRSNNDILNISTHHSKLLIVLLKRGTINIMDMDLTILHTLTAEPSQFDLGWPYKLSTFLNYISWSADQGVYITKFPDSIFYSPLHLPCEVCDKYLNTSDTASTYTDDTSTTREDDLDQSANYDN